MTKTNSPLLSFSARGTVANSLTFQKKGTETIARSKPTPTYRKTLPQQYQRWLYEDYCYLWTKQTSAIKAVYAQKASRNHTTAMAEWLRYCLFNLPDIALLLHLDVLSAGKTFDSSTHGNHATNYGAVITPGLIAWAFSFDGTDDYLLIPASPSLNIPPTNWSIEFIISPLNTSTTQFLFYKEGAVRLRTPQDWISRNFSFDMYHAGVGWDTFKTNGAIDYGVPSHYVCLFDGTYRKLYRDGTFLSQQATGFSVPDNLTNDIYLGIPSYITSPFKGMCDHLIIYTRVLDEVEIKRHSQRRYSPE